MNKSRVSELLLGLALFGAAMPARAADPDPEHSAPLGEGSNEPPAGKSKLTDSINLSALLVLGAVIITYEHLVAQRHGIVVEGYYSNAFNPSTQSWTGGLAYRYHFSEGMGGLFAGPFVRGGYLREGLNTEYELECPYALVGANIGYRFQFDVGPNFVLRAGYGYQFYSDYRWTPRPPDDAATRKALNGLDIEVSLGFSF